MPDNPLRVMHLKNTARRAYMQYHDACDRLSCGASLAVEISPAASDAKRRFNEAMDALAKIDPSTPKARL